MMSVPSSASTQTSFDRPCVGSAPPIDVASPIRASPPGITCQAVPSNTTNMRSISGRGSSPSPTTQGTTEATGRRVAA